MMPAIIVTIIEIIILMWFSRLIEQYYNMNKG